MYKLKRKSRVAAGLTSTIIVVLTISWSGYSNVNPYADLNPGSNYVRYRASPDNIPALTLALTPITTFVRYAASVAIRLCDGAIETTSG